MAAKDHRPITQFQLFQYIGGVHATAATRQGIVALCKDGTLWRHAEGKWQQLEGPPVAKE